MVRYAILVFVLAGAATTFGQPLTLPPAQESKGEAAKDATPFAGWDNGFFIRSPDKNFQLRLTGHSQTDFRAYLNDRDSLNVDSFLARRVRLGIEAIVAQYYEFRFLSDFGLNQPRILDGFLNIRYWDAFQVELGRFRQPFSYEQLIPIRYLPTMERSLIDQFVPARDVGVMVHGQKIWQNRIDYALSISNGERDGDGDPNPFKDFVSRLAMRPFAANEDLPALQSLQFGMAVTTGWQREPVSPSIFRSGNGILWFRFLPGVRSEGMRTRLSPEVAWFYQQFGIAAQYFHMQQTLLSPAAVSVLVPWNGFLVFGSWLLTGEERTGFSQQVKPLRPFDPRMPLAAPGAWEIALRVSRMQIGDFIFAPGAGQLADPFTESPGATELLVGMNWYLNAWIRMQINWERLWFDRPVQQGATAANRIGHQDAVLLRMQVTF